MKPKHLQSIVDTKLQEYFLSQKEFESNFKLMGYYVLYDRPVCQQNIYQFWNEQLVRIMREHFKRSTIEREDLIAAFTFGAFKPLGLGQIIDQLIKEGYIVEFNGDFKNLEAQLNQKQNQTYSLTNIRRVWNYLKQQFTYEQENEAEVPSSNNILFVNQFKHNLKTLDSQLKVLYKENRDEVRIFSDLQLNKTLHHINLDVKEAELIIKFWLFQGKIELLGENITKGRRQHIYAEINGLTKNQIQRDFGIYQIEHELKTIELMMKERDNNLNILENALNQAIKEGKRKSEKMMLFKQKKMLEDSIEKYTQKKLLLIKYVDSLETAQSDSVMLEVLNQVNKVLANQPDVQAIQDAVQEFQEKSAVAQEINSEIKQISKEDDIEDELKQYEQQMKAEQDQPQAQEISQKAEKAQVRNPFNVNQQWVKPMQKNDPNFERLEQLY